MMTTNLKIRIGTGITPSQFVKRMTKNQDKFQDWYHRFEFRDAGDKSFFEGMRGDALHCIIIAADWCGDVVRNVPVVFRLLEVAHIQADVMIMEEHLDLMDEFLTIGGRSIPVVLFLNQEGDLIGRWGPRPRKVQEVMEAFKTANPSRDAADYETNLQQARREMGIRYGEGTDYQQLIVKEIRQLFESMQ